MNTENLKFDSKAAVAFGGNKMFLGKDFVGDTVQLQIWEMRRHIYTDLVGRSGED